jgi:phosphoheptose isomerase
MINFEQQKEEFNAALNSVDVPSVMKAHKVVLDSIQNNLPIFVFGNGGSAGIANHWVCDMAKGITEDTHLSCNITSLSSNIELITAIANDIGYEYCFERQLKYHLQNSNKSGVAVAISSSGNSKNILNGLSAAKKLNLKTIALVGFNGGVVNNLNLADIIIHVKNNNYGIVEDTHMFILHYIAQAIRKDFTVKKNIIL